MDSSEEDGSQQGYGPALPPHLKKQKVDEIEKHTLGTDCYNVIGPVLPPQKTLPKIGPSMPPDRTLLEIGPSMPPNLSSQFGPSLPPSSSSQIGPALPPNISSQTGPVLPPDRSTSQIGPALPPNYKTSDLCNDNHTTIGPALPPGHKSSTQELPPSYIRPVLPPGFKSSEEEPMADVDENPDYTIGPLPSEMASGCVPSAVEEIEERAQKMKELLTEKPSTDPGPASRESWMTELPSQLRKSIGLNLQARNFRKRDIPDSERDASGWTETPADRERKAKEKEKRRWRAEESEQTRKPAKEEKSAKEMKKHKKSKHTESLLEMHQKERKKKKKKQKEKPKERRPFDRDADLQVNRFDDAKRKAIIQRSQELNTRFKHAGSTSSFL